MATIEPTRNGYGLAVLPTATDIDPNGAVSNPILILANRGGEKIGVIDAPIELTFSFELNAPFEMSFLIDKVIDDAENSLWDKIETFRLIYVPQWNIWFEIDVQISEENSLRKSVTGIRLQEAELGQTILYGVEINTENDIAREDYSPTVFYDESNPEASLLNRVLSKAPHYSVIHVDESLASLQRTFEFEGTSILDAFNEIADEIGCLFVYGESEDLDGKIARTVSAYDLFSYCPSCGYRGNFDDVCPKCGYEHPVDAYGDDTTIFVTADVLGDAITVDDDKDSVKNCFHLVGGDDLMTATIINCNPNGTQYMWNITPYFRKQMSLKLRRRLEKYDRDYEYYQNSYRYQVPSGIVSGFNSLINKYQAYDSSLTTMPATMVGYSEIVEWYYNALDFYGYLNTTLMPSETPTTSSAAQELAKLTVANLSPLGVTNATTASKATVESTLMTYAKVYVDTSRYSVEILSGSTYSNRVWRGSFVVTSLTDASDTATGSTISITVTDATDTFVKQKIDKMLAKETIEACDCVQLFDMTLADFKTAIKGHCLANLELIRSASDSCLEIMISAGIASKKDVTLYNELYTPYYQKQKAVDEEIKVRETELNTVDKAINTLDKARQNIIDILNFETYIKAATDGDALWAEFCSFRREDEYSNGNYISEGLTNAELIERAVEFLDVAREEIAKASELQYTISSTLKNLLATHEFDPLPSYFRLGNWLRVGIDDEVYKLRLVGYTLDFDNIDNFSVTFSNVTKAAGFMTDVQDILSRAKSMSTSYSYVQRQAAQGADADRRMNLIATTGLDLTNNKIVSNADNQDVVYDKHGMLFREYNDVLDAYDDKQTKIINRGLYFTTDNWETAKAGVGDFYYYDPDTETEKEGYGVIADTIVGNIILSNEVGVYNESGTIKLTENGIDIVADGTSGDNQMAFTISKTTSSGTTRTFYLDSNGNAHFNGAITATSLTLGTGVTIGASKVSGLATVATSGKYSDLSGTPDLSRYIYKDGTIGSKPASGATGFVVSSAGLLEASNAIIYGKLYSSEGTIGGWTLASNSLYSGSDTGYVALNSNTSDTYAIWAGNATAASAPFRVTRAGVLYATGASINGSFRNTKGTEWVAINESVILGGSTSSTTDGTLDLSANGSDGEIYTILRGVTGGLRLASTNKYVSVEAHEDVSITSSSGTVSVSGKEDVSITSSSGTVSVSGKNAVLGDSSSNGHLWLYSSSGKIDATLGTGSNGGYLTLGNTSAVTKVHLSVGTDGGYLQLMHGSNTNVTANLSSTSNGGQLLIRNSSGKLNAWLATSTRTSDNGAGYLWLYDASGTAYSTITPDGLTFNNRYPVYGYTTGHNYFLDWRSDNLLHFIVDTSDIGTLSDRRVKKNITDISEAYKEAIGSVDLKEFNFDRPEEIFVEYNKLRRVGAIAQDVISALEANGIDYKTTEFISETQPNTESDEIRYSINYIPFLIARIAHMEDQIKELRQRLNE